MMAEMGFIPAGAYRNREFTAGVVFTAAGVSRAMQDICYDPQTSGGLLMAIPEENAAACLAELNSTIPQAAIVGYVTQKDDYSIYLE